MIVATISETTRHAPSHEKGQIRDSAQDRGLGQQKSAALGGEYMPGMEELPGPLALV